MPSPLNPQHAGPVGDEASGRVLELSPAETFGMWVYSSVSRTSGNKPALPVGTALSEVELGPSVRAVVPATSGRSTVTPVKVGMKSMICGFQLTSVIAVMGEIL